MKPTTLPDRRAFAWRLFAAALPLLIAAAPAAAQINAPAQNSAPAPATAAAPRAADPDPVLIGNTIAQVRRSDYELELLRLPPEARDGFGANKGRVQELLSRMLVTKTLAAQARAAKLDQDPEVVARFKGESERFYAGVRIAMVERAAGAEFDAKAPQMDARARELYLANLKTFDMPEQVSASHILFALDRHTKDEALKLAQDTRARIVAGENFNLVAVKVSEDESVKQNMGKLEFFSRAEMDPAFSDGAFSLAKVGDLSQPVLSKFGWHLIRLDGRKAGGPRAYEDVRATILIQMKKQYVNEKRDALVGAVDADPSTTVDEAAIDALYVHPPEAAMPMPAADAPKPLTTGGKPTKEQKEAIRARQAEQLTPKN